MISLSINILHVPSNDTVVKIFTHPENDLDGEFYVHVRYDMDLMINSNAYEILLIWFVVIFLFIQYQGRIQDFKLGGGAL